MNIQLSPPHITLTDGGICCELALIEGARNDFELFKRMIGADMTEAQMLKHGFVNESQLTAIHEGVISSIFGAIAKIFKAIGEFIGKLLGGGKSSSSKSGGGRSGGPVFYDTSTSDDKVKRDGVAALLNGKINICKKPEFKSKEEREEFETQQIHDWRDFKSNPFDIKIPELSSLNISIDDEDFQSDDVYTTSAIKDLMNDALYGEGYTTTLRDQGFTAEQNCEEYNKWHDKYCDFLFKGFDNIKRSVEKIAKDAENIANRQNSDKGDIDSAIRQMMNEIGLKDASSSEYYDEENGKKYLNSKAAHNMYKICNAYRNAILPMIKKLLTAMGCYVSRFILVI